ncbi:methyltransferase domain-containing protein [Helicobacter sp.]|uniref:methyltransferase domain-containing protein n=1 Tax=Helicobacter sp. TaxID=218 RepID=UPI0025BBC01F|nr:methyltransferase domain-containing protein [Helicobacter sp.]MCI5968864.1 class I SAM-dependent methyltransferase [Helicobacter sp.]MDY2585049.1 methyltransferase domain-containing protein [Helicobacter sp.]
MLQKDSIQKRFHTAKATYKQNANIQNGMQKTLLALLKKHAPNHLESVLELGCGNGDFSKKIMESFLCKDYYALDLVDFSSDFVDSNICFLQGDFEHLDSLLPSLKFNCILSNAALQWSNQRTLLPLLSQRLKPNGILLFSTFGTNNFKELKELFGLSLDYLDLQDYPILLENCEILECFESTQILRFNSPLEIFKHLQNTGVNALKRNFTLKKAHLKEYETRFQNALTYHILFICAKLTSKS